MEQNKAERLNENVTEKMCSSDVTWLGKCVPQPMPTHVESAVKLVRENQRIETRVK